jgi:predicted 2-oxoglutarate/Fe(II)-dependent dioxygenase YbiX/peroxiredoxin
MGRNAPSIIQNRMPRAGEPAPFFTAATDHTDRYSFEVAAGRWLMLLVFGSAAKGPPLYALDMALGRRELFDDLNAAFFGVSIDTADRTVRGLANSDPGVRFFWDFDAAVSRLYGAVEGDSLNPTVFLIDPAFRIVMAEPIAAMPAVLDRLEQELRAAPSAEDGAYAPVLTLPRILEPQMCQALIDYFLAGDPTESGFAKDVDGRTVLQVNPLIKRRADVLIEDEALVDAVRTRLETRLFPMVKRTLGWQPQHIERYLICRYTDADQGFFSAHRDDVTLGTAHRKFAVSLNLNAEDYEGGDLRFPEFGRRTYRPPTGGATVFCCSLLHEATPVTRGQRYVLVPFLYDDEGEKLRRANLSRVGAAPAAGNRQARRSDRRR